MPNVYKSLQKVPKNVGDLGKLIVAKGFKKLPNVQKIANSGHTGLDSASASSFVGKEKSQSNGHVVQMVDNSLPTPEVRSSNPVVGYLWCTYCQLYRLNGRK